MDICWLGSTGGRAYHFLYIQHRRQEAGHRGKSPDFALPPTPGAPAPGGFRFGLSTPLRGRSFPPLECRLLEGRGAPPPFIG